MKQLFLEKGTVTPHHVPTPHPGPHDLLVKLHYSFISTGTEGATISESKKNILQKCLSNTTEKIDKVRGAVKDNGLMGTMALIKGSLIKVMELGYSCSGHIVATGENVSGFAIGDFVACAGAGIANHAEYISVPKHLAVKLPSAKHVKEASLTTIGAIALQGVRRADIKLGEKVCVIGLGLIGQLTVQLAKLSGATVYGVDIDDAKLFLAQKFGCAHTYNSYATEIISEILFHTEHHGVDTTIITAAAQSGEIIQQAMEITRRKGKVVLVGDVKIDFDRNPFYKKEIDFLISCSYGPGRYDSAYEKRGIDYPYSYVRWTENRNMQLFADLIFQEKISVSPLVSSEFAFEQADKAYELLMQRKALGLLLHYDTNETKEIKEEKEDIATEHEVQPIAYAKPYSSPQGELNIGCIGAGGFAKVKLLPIVSKIKNTKLHTIVDIDPANMINVSKQYKALHCDNDYQNTLSNKSIHALLIATPHALHAQQAIAALKAGKAVFVEKPAAVTHEQFYALQAFLKKNKNYLYCVDFNRSFAPFILQIKKAIQNRTTPLIIHYRMNAGFIPKNHWIQSKNHGGRIIGEACHIFELFQFLTDAQPTAVSVNSIDTTRDDLLKNDNFSVQITFDDGSLCTLLYTALGNKALAKERMEIFFDGKSIVMDDYKELQGYGLPRSFNKKTKQADKGHQTLLNLFMKAAQSNGPCPLTVERILCATKLSLEVNELVMHKKHTGKKDANNKII